MKKRIIMFIMAAVLLTGCGKKTEEYSYSTYDEPDLPVTKTDKPYLESMQFFSGSWYSEEAGKKINFYEDEYGSFAVFEIGPTRAYGSNVVTVEESGNDITMYLSAGCESMTYRMDFKVSEDKTSFEYCGSTYYQLYADPDNKLIANDGYDCDMERLLFGWREIKISFGCGEEGFEDEIANSLLESLAEYPEYCNKRRIIESCWHYHEFEERNVITSYSYLDKDSEEGKKLVMKFDQIKVNKLYATLYIIVSENEEGLVLEDAFCVTGEPEGHEEILSLEYTELEN